MLRNDDRIAILFDTFNSHRTGYRFETNANGVRNDMLINGNINNGDWSVIWDVATSVHDGYWAAEFAIPFKSLPFDPRNDTWGLNISRAIRRMGEETAWVTHDRAWGVGVTGSLSGLSGMQQGLGLDLVPGLTLGTHNDRVAGERFDGLLLGGVGLHGANPYRAAWARTPSSICRTSFCWALGKRVRRSIFCCS